MDIRKIIKEEIDNFDWVNDVETPLSWLIDNFSDLTPVVRGDKIYYVDDNYEKLFFYYRDEENGNCYIKYDEIWSLLGSRFGINYNKIQEVTTIWLDKAYGITGLIPTDIIFKT